MKAPRPLKVDLVVGKPRRVNGERVSHLVDAYRFWPNWWEGQSPRDYFVLEVEVRTIEIYRSEDGWFFSRVLD